MEKTLILITILSLTIIAIYFGVRTMGETKQRGFTFSRCVELGNHPRECI